MHFLYFTYHKCLDEYGKFLKNLPKINGDKFITYLYICSLLPKFVHMLIQQKTNKYTTFKFLCIICFINTYHVFQFPQGKFCRFRFSGHTLTGQNQDSSYLPGCQTPALAFFHIPIPEIRQLYYQKITGQFQEAVACSFINTGVLKSFVAMGNVKAVFIGHDHKNDFCGNIAGIWFCYGGGFGYHGYGKAGWPRRARVILAELGKGEFAWMGVQRIKTWKRLDDEKLSKIDEQVLWQT